MPFTPDQALERARQLAPAYGLTDVQLPSGDFFASALNGIEACEGYLAANPELATPSPYPKPVAAPVVEP